MVSDKTTRQNSGKESAMSSRLDALLEKKGAPKISDLPPVAERARLRRAIGLSQDDVAALLETNRPSVSAWERGKWEPRGAMHGKYLNLLNEISDRLRTADTEGTDDVHA
jgi:DNA-binding transcriptional regulator YiaG